MALVTATKEQVRAYRESGGLNQSTLKKLLGGLRELKREETPPSPAMATGSAVDCLLLGQPGQFADEYACVQGEGLSPVERKIVEDVHATAPHPDWDGLRETVARAIEANNWQPKWKTETRVEKILGKGRAYFGEVCGAEGKARLDPQQWQAVHGAARSLLESPRTRHYFDREAIAADTDRTVHHQLPVYFRHKGLECKALIDILVVHRFPGTEEVSHVEAVDLKTMSGPVLEFPLSLRKFRYDLQAAWYTLAARYWTEQQGMREAPVENFRFAVESTTGPGTPLVFQVSDALLRQGLRGAAEVKICSAKLRAARPGIDQLLDDWCWYGSNGWDTDRAVAMHGGDIPIDWDSIPGT